MIILSGEPSAPDHDGFVGFRAAHLDPAAVDAQLNTTRQRAARATYVLTAGVIGAAVGGAVLAQWLALLPVAFLLGWLNLVGL